MPTGTRKKEKITRREFEKRVAKLIGKHLATLPEKEREARLQAAERRLAKISRDARTKDARIPETPSIRFQPEIVAQNAEIIPFLTILIYEHLRNSLNPSFRPF